MFTGHLDGAPVYWGTVTKRLNGGGRMGIFMK